MNSIFTERAWKEYISWQNEDKKTLKKINILLTDIQRNGTNSRIGKSEILKNRQGYSKRIDDKNRLVYDFDCNGNVVIIYSIFNIINSVL